MKDKAFVVTAVLLLTACMSGSEEDPGSGGHGNVDGLPQLHSDLDSIVFNQLDYLYVTRGRQDPPLIFSQAARALLTDDTLLFQRDSVYDYSDTIRIEFPFARTRFNPKGWLAFYDDMNGMICSVHKDEPKEWLLSLELDPENHYFCRKSSAGTPRTSQLWVQHYREKGFVFDPNTGIGARDFGKARVYYWK